MTCVVVLTSKMVVARIEEEETNSVLIKVVEITSVEISVVAKGGETLILAGEGVTV